ncbi:MAG: cell division protein SepF [Microbacteriaceae bacterium]|nr:cell division protein SepF [Microbacteriaceae bacterium]
MGNPLKKTMVFLGLAEEDLDDAGAPVDTGRGEAEATAAPAQPVRAHVTPLRKVAPVRTSSASAMNEILTMHPTEYSDATVVAQSFRDGVPVILNLSRMNEAEAKRLIDFASGLVMGLHGRIERVTSKVFLLSPEHVAVSSDSSAKTGDSESFFVSATA